MNRSSNIADGTLAILQADFALPPQPIAQAEPPIALGAEYKPADVANRIIGRPHFLCQDNPELAREVNDRLASGSLA